MYLIFFPVENCHLVVNRILHQSKLHTSYSVLGALFCLQVRMRMIEMVSHGQAILEVQNYLSIAFLLYDSMLVLFVHCLYTCRYLSNTPDLFLCTLAMKVELMQKTVSETCMQYAAP